jgi:hypothetical protein
LLFIPSPFISTAIRRPKQTLRTWRRGRYPVFPYIRKETEGRLSVCCQHPRVTQVVRSREDRRTGRSGRVSVVRNRAGQRDRRHSHRWCRDTRRSCASQLTSIGGPQTGRCIRQGRGDRLTRQSLT